MDAFSLIKKMTKETGKFLHRELDDEKHTYEQVKKAFVDVFPKSLSQKCSAGLLPTRRQPVQCWRGCNERINLTGDFFPYICIYCNSLPDSHHSVLATTLMNGMVS